MFKQTARLILLVPFLFLQAAAHGDDMSSTTMMLYGNELPKEGKVTPLKHAIETMAVSKDKSQKISGVVKKVCKKKGCWIILADNGAQARVKFKDYGFFVAPGTGRVKAIVYGKLAEATLSEERAKHFARDAGNSSDHITGPVKEYTIVASGIYLEQSK